MLVNSGNIHTYQIVKGVNIIWISHPNRCATKSWTEDKQESWYEVQHGREKEDGRVHN